MGWNAVKSLRWHHFYVLLAAFDLSIIAGGLYLHRTALRGFGELLHEAGRFDSQQRWLAALRQRLIEAAGPGNDVFRARDVAAARARFQNVAAGVGRLKTDPALGGERMRRFWEEVGKMFAKEEEIFRRMEEAPAATTSHAGRFEAAAASMSEMEASQARALRHLEAQSESLLTQAAKLQLRHQTLAGRHELAQRVFLAALVLNIAGVLWYNRTLRRTDEYLQTQQRRAETERRERLAAVGEICSGVAHGIKNPLAAIRSSAELIAEMGRVDPASRRRAEDILAECTRLSERVSRLLTFAAAEPAPRAPLLVQQVVDETITELRARFEDRKVSIDVQECREPLVVTADRHELTSVLIELLSNAIEHAPAGSAVRIRLASRDGRATVDVSDEGPGITPSAAADIFKLFYSTRPGGTGVGLASAKRRVESMDGTIEYVNDAPQGATFRVSLPLTDQKEPVG